MSKYIEEMSSEEIELAYNIEKELLKNVQKPITTMHSLYAGIYTRSIMMVKDEVLVGATIDIDTTIIIQGHLRLTINNKVEEINGFDIILGSKGRKQTMYALDDTFVTMIFKTDAKDIESAEEEFTKDYARLLSRNPDAINIIRSLQCQEQ